MSEGEELTASGMLATSGQVHSNHMTLRWSGPALEDQCPTPRDQHGPSHSYGFQMTFASLVYVMAR